MHSLRDLKYFIIVFFFIVFSFADAFLSAQHIIDIEAGKTIDDERTWDDLTWYEAFLKPYVGAVKLAYMTSIGEFDPIDKGMGFEDLDWIVFFLSTLINVIVLLNALIALTGETFAEIFAN